ncbi:BON1-associated protein 1-like [Trifolium pratense]|uniref:BON1-associated protein 1-like n=1 Tax=Trifolium pratense TaxID=57577 RepID=UPI001E690CE5|nr:BON1-associated protein 1-like [Trifolium pratense]
MSRTVEITILNVENICANKNSIKKNAFVSLECDSSNEICYSTKENSEECGGGSCLSWNEKLVMEVPFNARFIIADVKCKTSWGNIKSVGMARIPLSDLYVQDNQVQFLSYRLWDSNVMRNGVINISVKVKSLEYSFPVTGIPVTGIGLNEIVTGIPIWLSNLQRNC